MKAESRFVHIDGKKKLALNSTAIIELARTVNTPQARSLLRAYNEAECKIARESPFLSEEKYAQKPCLLLSGPSAPR